MCKRRETSGHVHVYVLHLYIELLLISLLHSKVRSAFMAKLSLCVWYLCLTL